MWMRSQPATERVVAIQYILSKGSKSSMGSTSSSVKGSLTRDLAVSFLLLNSALLVRVQQAASPTRDLLAY